MEDPIALRAPRQGLDARVLARNLDIVLLVIAAAPALLLGAPALGFGIGAGAWILQRILQKADRGWVMRPGRAPRAILGLNTAEAYARIWLLAGAIVASALIGGHKDGLAAAVTIFCAYSVAFVTRVLSGPPGKVPAR